MARSELIAEVSLACFFITPMVGIAISIRIRMIAMTISSSINVKPLGGVKPFGALNVPLWVPCARPRRPKILQSMDFRRLIMEQAEGFRPVRENATTLRRRGQSGRSEQVSVVT